MFVVADVYQSINSFAGGGPAYLEQFVADFYSDEKRLTTNFRSASLIIKALDSLRRRIENTPRLPPTGQGNLAPGWIDALSYVDEESEARAVSDRIRRLLKDGLDPAWVYEEGEGTGVEPEDVCLLGRTRYAFNAVITELEAHDIPVVKRIENGALFESRLGRCAYEALQLAENPGNLPARRRLSEHLGFDEPWGSGVASQPLGGRNLLEAFEGGENMPPEFVRAFAPSNDTSSNDLQVVRNLVTLDLALRRDEMVAWQRDQELLEQLLTDYEISRSPATRSLSGFLRMLARNEETPLSVKAVRALTPYRARGLGFKVVIVLGMNEGTFPYYRASTPVELDEERRVVYVAASRAARALLMTRPRQRRSRYGRPYECQVSRFVAEMGLEMMDVG